MNEYATMRLNYLRAILIEFNAYGTVKVNLKVTGSVDSRVITEEITDPDRLYNLITREFYRIVI